MTQQNRETVAQLSYNRDFRWFGLLRLQFAIYWFWGGLRDLEKFRGPVGGPKWPFWPQLGATGEFSGYFWLIWTGRPLRTF